MGRTAMGHVYLVNNTFVEMRGAEEYCEECGESKHHGVSCKALKALKGRVLQGIEAQEEFVECQHQQHHDSSGLGGSGCVPATPSPFLHPASGPQGGFLPSLEAGENSQHHHASELELPPTAFNDSEGCFGVEGFEGADMQGAMMHPLVYDPNTDSYVPMSWCMVDYGAGYNVMGEFEYKDQENLMRELGTAGHGVADALDNVGQAAGTSDRWDELMIGEDGMIDGVCQMVGQAEGSWVGGEGRWESHIAGEEVLDESIAAQARTETLLEALQEKLRKDEEETLAAGTESSKNTWENNRSRGGGNQNHQRQREQQRQHHQDDEDEEEDASSGDGPEESEVQKTVQSQPQPTPTFTTVMLRNIPNKYTREMLIKQLDQELRGLFDFVYLPIDFKNRCNVGYGFINFRSIEACELFMHKFNGVDVRKCLPGLNSRKVAEVTPARVQGLDENVNRLKNSPVMGELAHHPEWMPLIFDEEGCEKPFPVPDQPLPPVKQRRRGRDELAAFGR